MTTRRLRSRPALSCLREFKLARQRPTENKTHSTPKVKLIKEQVMESQSTPKAMQIKKEMQSQNVNEGSAEGSEHLVVIDPPWLRSIGLVDYLHSVMPPHEHMLIQELLVKLLLRTDSTIREKVVEHARRQMRLSCDICEPIDWTGLTIPAHICQAVWQVHCFEKLFQQ